MALEPELVISQWNRARKVSNQSALPLGEVDITNCWSILFDLFAENSMSLRRRSPEDNSSLKVVKAICRRLLSGDDDVDGQVVRELLNEIPGLSDRFNVAGKNERRASGRL